MSNDQRPYILTHKCMVDDWLLCTVTSTNGGDGTAGRSVMFRLELTKMGQVWTGKN